MRNTILFLAIALAGLSALGGLSVATPELVPSGARGNVVVPDRFLRRWDPVTIFFAKAIGSAGPEDHPERFVKMTPAQPGAFTWLDAKTLQFRPAEPWPALSRITLALKDEKFTLATLMNPPSQTIPNDLADDLEPVEAITLTFPEPIDVEALAKMTRIELRPRPGLDGTGARWIDREDFTVKTLERASPGDVATYVLQLEEPIPESTRAIVHFKLSLEDQHQEAFSEFSFTTLDAFRVIAFGCRGRSLPVTPEGTTYNDAQAIACPPYARAIDLELSSQPGAFDPVVARNLIRFTPSVEELEFTSQGRSISVSGRFEPEKRYQLSLHPTALLDHRGRPLDLRAPSRMSFYFPHQPDYLGWQKSYGTVERFGPKTVPMEGRGFDRVDLRIVPIDPLDRTWWPFTPRPVVVDESKRPPGPGEEPSTAIDPYHLPSMEWLESHLSALGSPPLSRIVDLPLAHRGTAHSFGLDLEPHLAFLSGKNKPGHYLVGVRKLDGSSERHWARLEVTDLSLSIAEEPHRVRFFVTSLRTGRPVAGATVRVEGVEQPRYQPRSWTAFFEAKTNGEGAATWDPPGAEPDISRTVRRVVAELDGDVLAIDPDRPPDRFRDDRWQRGTESGWLQWTVNSRIDLRGDQPQTLCHVFTERPVYRPEDKVHVAGYVRTRHEGALSKASGDWVLEVRGSGNLNWVAPMTLSKTGAFHHEFAQKDLPTGVYSATLMTKQRQPYCDVSFRMEAYRIPTFDVRLFGEDQVPIDRAFDVKLTANYYAGGPVAARPVRWRVTQFPYTWDPPNPIEGFAYSTDARYSRLGDFQASSALSREAVTDERGASAIDLNPAIEPTAQPRTYVIEATLTGADDQTVTGTKQVHAVPPFVLGLKAPRFLEKGAAIRADAIMVDASGKPIADREMTVRLIHRTWHSHLQASDFSDGSAKYITDVVDLKIAEKKVQSAKGAVPIELPIEEGGVYLIELEARDRLGRGQVVAVDLFAAGDRPIAWKKPEDRVFEVTTDRDRYEPGETAKFVLQSPFLEARALAIIEGPDHNEYHWLPVEKGVGTFSYRVQKNEVPRLPVHFVLMRGRIGGNEDKKASADLGKPITMTATKWIAVDPIEHRVEVALEHPEKARPGEEVKVKIKLTDPKKRPLSGEVMLWLVDQAVLALGTEQKLDPLDAFITPARSYLSVTDSRNAVFGRLPLVENPGGDGDGEAESAAEGLLDKVTVRKNFKTVPVFLPAIEVGSSGETTVKIALPDNLTNFKVRAKAISGVARFGFAKSTIAVRLPVIVQPALPRFVRAGDRFSAGGLARVVEGDAGPGRAELAVTGAKLEGNKSIAIELEPNRPLPLRFPLTVASPLFDRDPEKHPKVALTLGVERKKDGAKDAFRVELPMRADRPIERRRIMKTAAPGELVKIDAVDEPFRSGTFERTILISDEPALVRMAAGLDVLMEYPHGTTEVRVSRARAFLAMERFRKALSLQTDPAATERAVKDAMDWIAQVVDGNGSCAYWPGTRGYVSLTAWSVDFLVEAKEAGYRVDDKLFDKLIATLERALRSDYSYFIGGEEWAERVYALQALAHAQRFSAAYAAELSRKADYLNLESTAGVVESFFIAKQPNAASIPWLSRKLWDGVIFRLHQGHEIYGGLQERHGARSSLILPSETRTLAEMTRALGMAEPKQAKLQVLVDALVTLGRDDGWGTTNANAAALLALAERIDPSRATTKFEKTDRHGTLEIPIRGTKPMIVRVETSYVPMKPGSTVEAESRGFVVTREHLRIVGDAPPEKVRIEESKTLEVAIAGVVEEHVQVVNPKERNFVAITVPLAAGMEPLNASLATSPPEARPTGRDTRAATHVAFLDDRITYFFDTLPKGTFDFYFRTRASTEGSFTQPAAYAEMMYDGTITGRSPGAKVVVKRAE
jgi:alpha-2-macroglobulin